MGWSDGEAAYRATGVRMADGSTVRARHAVLSNATPYHTFMELLPGILVLYCAYR